MESVLSACRVVGAKLRHLALWVFAPRHTLDGGTTVYKGELIAEGGFSFVYLAYDVATRTRLVLKEVRVDEPEQYALATREMEHHRRYDHPNLMPLLDSATATPSGLALLAFPLCSRGSLRDAINAKVLAFCFNDKDLGNAPSSREKETDRWRRADFARLFEGTCAGARAIHAAGFAHRDIKPENVLIADDGRPVLMDFGSMGPAVVAVATRRDALLLQDDASTHCTMPYRAPELWDPSVGSLDATKADVWSLGCLVWAMAFGYSPFEAEFPGSGASASKAEAATTTTQRGPAAPQAAANTTNRGPPPGSTARRGASAAAAAPPPRPRIVETSHLRVLSTPAPPPVETFPGTAHDAPFFRLVEATARALLVPDPGSGSVDDQNGGPPPSPSGGHQHAVSRPSSDRALELAAKLVAYPDLEQ